MPSCYAEANPTYLPALRLITAITQANLAAVTTSFDHNYITGEIVRMTVPNDNGMIQMNNKTGTITVTGATTFTIDIDSTSFDAFTVPVSELQCAYVVPIGEVNSILTAATHNIL